ILARTPKLDGVRGSQEAFGDRGREVTLEQTAQALTFLLLGRARLVQQDHLGAVVQDEHMPCMLVVYIANSGDPARQDDAGAIAYRSFPFVRHHEGLSGTFRLDD